jgi:magnesium chelatase family protein
VSQSRARQAERFHRLRADGIRLNSECPPALLDDIAMPDSAGTKLLRQAADAFHLSARGYHRVLRVARTLADLDGMDTVMVPHIAEALSCRGEEVRQAPSSRLMKMAGG